MLFLFKRKQMEIGGGPEPPPDARFRNQRFVETKRPFHIGIDVSHRRNAHSAGFQTLKT